MLCTVISGALPLGLALRFVVLRGQVMRPDPMRPGAMVAISAKHAAVDSLCTKAREAGSIDIAVYNSSESYVVSGDSLAVELFIEGAKKANLRVVSLNVDQGHPFPPRIFEPQGLITSNSFPQ